MAPVTPYGVPDQFIVGDTLLFQIAFGDYPSSEGWTLAFTFAGAKTLHTEVSEVSSSGTTHTVTVPATRTTLLSPGVYRWFAYATGSGTYAGRRHLAGEGRCEVRANPATAQDNELQEQVEKDLAIVRAAKTGRLTDEMASYMIRGRQVVLLSYTDLVKEERRLERALWRLKHPGRAWPAVKVVFP